MKKGALWIIGCLCFSITANAQQETPKPGLDKALDDIASELVDKLNRIDWPEGAMLSVANIGFRLDGDTGIVECAPLSSNLETGLTDRLIDHPDNLGRVSVIKPPPGLSPDTTLVGYWEKIDNESVGINFELRNTQDPEIARTLDIASRRLLLAHLDENQPKCIFDLVPGPTSTTVAEGNQARIVSGPNLFGQLLKRADPGKKLTVIRVAVVGKDRWAIVPLDKGDLEEDFGFVDCKFLTNCKGGFSPLLVGAGVVALAGGALALGGGGGGGTDPPESACPNFLGRDQIAVDFDGEGGPGMLTFSINRIDNNTVIETYIEIDTDDAAIGPDEILVPFNNPNTSFDIEISRPSTSLFFTYVRVDPADATNTNFEMQVSFDTTRLLSFRGDSISNVSFGQPSNVAEKTICLEFATE